MTQTNNELRLRIKTSLYDELPDDKIKINWNKNPIPMELFLSFLTVPVEIIRKHFGSDNGWTQRRNKDLGLIIRGGWYKNTEWLDGLEFGEKLSNKYNNIVNPFYLFGILSLDGRQFFIEYYRDEIEERLAYWQRGVEILKRKLEKEINTLNEVTAEVEVLRSLGTISIL